MSQNFDILIKGLIFDFVHFNVLKNLIKLLAFQIKTKVNIKVMRPSSLQEIMFDPCVKSDYQVGYITIFLM